VGVGAVAILVVAVVAQILGFIGGPGEESYLIVGGLAGLVCVGLIYIVNQNGYCEVASLSFVIVLLLLNTFSDHPFDVSHGRSLLQFAIPIVVSSLILRPWASFVVAGVSSVIISLISYAIAQPLPNIPAIVVFNLIALLTWLATRSIESSQNALRKMNESLEDLVIRKTRELRDAQDQLIMNERLSVLGQVSGGIGHDLRNPLSSIKTAAYLLRMVLENPDTEAIEAIDIIEKDVAMSESIIESLLEFVSPKAPAQEPMMIGRVVEESLENIHVPSNVEVELNLNREIPPIHGDSVQLRQVIINITRNAIQSMREDGGIVAISTYQNPSEWIAISITDTGVGIPEENLERIFEPLFSTRANGIGLGLSLAKLLVEAHGGSITVESEVGKGSTFTVKLPKNNGSEIDYPLGQQNTPIGEN
jgi:signal transduction histidine kinase